MKTHKDLIVWKKSIDLVTLIYKHTLNFPKPEQYGLTNQMRRSAVSIPSNIAEGAGRVSTKEFLHFLSISVGSSSELETQLIISGNLGFLKTSIVEQLLTEIEDIRKMTVGLMKSIENNKK